MSAVNLIGLFLMALPFLALAAFTLIEEGWEGFAFVFGGTALVYLLIVGGGHLAGVPA